MKTKYFLFLIALMVAVSAGAQLKVRHVFPDEVGKFDMPDINAGTVTWDGTGYSLTLNDADAEYGSNKCAIARTFRTTEGTTVLNGDVNNSGDVDVADVNAVVDVILGVDDNPKADVNGDHEINIADINAIIDIILNSAEAEEHDYVDLGLPSGTLWATTNIGAGSPEESGDYFAWGETEPKDDYTWNTYMWCDGSETTMTKYCTDSRYGTVDGKKVLDPEDDAATVNWGPSWHMPSMSQQEELMEYCSWTWMTLNGVDGYEITGPNGNSLFLPAGGVYSVRSLTYSGSQGFYWSRTVESTYDYGGSNGAWGMEFTHDDVAWSYTYRLRYYGKPVRAVRSSSTDSQRLYIAQGSIDFLEVPIGEERVGQLTVINSTSESKSMTVTADAPFLLKQGGFSASSITVVVPANSGSTVTVLFKPTEPGEFNGNVTFQNLAFDGGECVIPLHAWAYVADSPEQAYVDLGLPSGTLWATMNVGASSPEEYGDYFAWGETVGKDVYNWETYKWCNGSRNTLTKYCTTSSYGIVDGKTKLDPEDDAATVNWGPSWCTPTTEQQSELFHKCTWAWTKRNGVKGYRVTGSNGNSIFIPAAGYRVEGSLKGTESSGCLWSKTCYTDNGISTSATSACDIGFESNSLYLNGGYSSRYYGHSVRPVRVLPANSLSFFIKEHSLDLGSVYIGDTGTGKLTIINYSMEDKAVTVTADAPFLLKQEEGGVSSMTVNVPSNSSLTMKVLFTATEQGEFNGNVTFQNPDLEEGQCIIPVQALAVPQHEYVDLGLPSGTLWATMNVGADVPEDYGDYFAWGETVPKDYYTWNTYKWCDGSEKSLTKYCTNSLYGTVDNKTELDPKDDAAYVNWGRSWRMPTEEQLYELFFECSWQSETQNGVKGRLVTGPNGNTIFMPAAGYCQYSSSYNVGSSGLYWSSTLSPDQSSYAFYHRFASGYMSWGGNDRSNGCTVRAVRVSPLEIQPRSIDMGEVSFGETRAVKLTIINYSSEDKTVTVTADAPFLLNHEGECASSVTIEVPGDSCSTLIVMSMASEPGEYKGNVTFENSALDGGQVAVPVHANVYTGDFPQYVDLGLPSGTLWATRNIGASSPEEHGDHFAWGETEPKDIYSWETYKWCNGSENTLTKYCTDSHYGTVDDKTDLEPQDDAASVNWGRSWRMPTHAQQEELLRNCTWMWTTRNGVKGYMITGPNGNTLFLPAAGERSEKWLSGNGLSGEYWARTGFGNYSAKAQSFDLVDVYQLHGVRSGGLSVRAVYEPQVLYIEQLSLDLGVAPIGVTRTGKLTIINQTNEDKNVTVTVDAPFLLKQEESSVSSMTVSVPGDSSATVEVVFTAEELGEFNGNVTFENPALDGGQCVIPIQARAIQQHEYVDLGLPSGTLWATMNVGADVPEEYGDYFAWGETVPKEVYDWSTYKWCDGSPYALTKYCTSSSLGTVDDKTELDPEDDAATVNWGSSWRIPSNEQQAELVQQCTWTWTIRNGVNGQLVTGPNGNSIFLPAAGRHSGESLLSAGSLGCNLSREVFADGEYRTYGLRFNQDGGHAGLNALFTRCSGFTVRPVRMSPIVIKQLSLDLGVVPIGETLTGKLDIINKTIEAQTMTVTADAPFLLKQEEGSASEMTVIIPANSSAIVEVVFTAEEIGEINGNVTFRNPALDGGERIVPVKASAVLQHEWVDLGLPSGTLWATRNIGATSPEDYGYYFAWGEIAPKTNEKYNFMTYKWYEYDGNSAGFTKYCTDSYYGYNDFTDGKTELDPEDDAATANWGSTARMPSPDQIEELINNCSWQWTQINDVYGKLGTGPNGNTIFLPAAGQCWNGSLSYAGTMGNYWTCTLDPYFPDHAYSFLFQETGNGFVYEQYYRAYGFPVRAVRAPQ